MLRSSIFKSSKDLAGVAAQSRRMLSPETSDSVGLVQQALIAVGEVLPFAGIDNHFGDETGRVVSAYKANRALSPSDPVVGPGTTRRLDLEVSYLDGNPADPRRLDAKALSLDPFFAGVLEQQLADRDIGQRVIDLFEAGDRFCFRASFLVDNFIAKALGEFIEKKVFDDFCQRMRGGRCTRDDFLDIDKGSRNYVDFLLAHNPTLDPVRIGELHDKRRPDILTHTPPREWWEIKPASVSGAIAAWAKFNSIIPNYAERGLPYLPGRSYQPSPEILLANLITDVGEKLDLVLALRHAAPGLIFWTLCVKGDYVLYFNRVRIAAGIAALLAALAEIAVPAAEAAGVVAALNEILQGLGIAVLPRLVAR